MIALGIPVGSNLIMSFSDSVSIQKFAFTLDNYRQVFSSASSMVSGIRHSLGLAGVSAVIGVLIGFCIAYVLTYSSFQLKKMIDMLTLVAMAVPGVVLGIGYIFIWNQKWLSSIGLHLYGKPSILVLASVASAHPNDQPRSGRRHGKDTGEPFDGGTDAGSRIFDKNKDNFASVAS